MAQALKIHEYESLIVPRDEDESTRDRVYNLQVQVAKTELQRARDHREHSEKLDRIEDLGIRTNGRVTKLEAWKRWLTGMVVGAGLVFAALKYWTEVRVFLLGGH